MAEEERVVTDARPMRENHISRLRKCVAQSKVEARSFRYERIRYVITTSGSLYEHPAE